MGQGETEKAVKTLQTGLAQVPDSTNLAYQLGELYITQGRFQEAEEIANRIQTFAPSDDHSQASLHSLIGRIQEAKGMVFEAKNAYQVAALLAPDVLPYLYRLGNMEEKLGNWQKALQIYQELIDKRYNAELIKERINVITKALDIQKDQAMWKDWVEKKEKTDQEPDEDKAGGP